MKNKQKVRNIVRGFKNQYKKNLRKAKSFIMRRF